MDMYGEVKALRAELDDLYAEHQKLQHRVLELEPAVMYVTAPDDSPPLDFVELCDTATGTVERDQLDIPFTRYDQIADEVASAGLSDEVGLTFMSDELEARS